MTNNLIVEKLPVAEKNLERLLEWVNRVDNKSLIVLGIVTGMLGVLATFAPPINLWNWFMAIFAIVSVIVLVTSLLCICLCSYPQTKGSSNSLLYFGSVAKYNAEQYREAFLKQSAEEYLNDLLEQCRRNSEILDRKFKSLKWAYRMLYLLCQTCQ